VSESHAGRGLTAYVLRTGEPLLATPDVFERLVASGEVIPIGAPSIDWLGAPLKSGDRTWGAIVTQSYAESTRYTQKDKEVLVFVAQHVASAVEQKRKEEALRDSERRYRQMFENTRAVQWLVDPESGAIVDANMAACDYYGYTRDELLAMKVWDINVSGEAGVRPEMVRAKAQEVSYFNFRHMKANGEIRDVEVHWAPSTPAAASCLSRSCTITDRRRAEHRAAAVGGEVPGHSTTRPSAFTSRRATARSSRRTSRLRACSATTGSRPAHAEPPSATSISIPRNEKSSFVRISRSATRTTSSCSGGGGTARRSGCSMRTRSVRRSGGRTSKVSCTISRSASKRGGAGTRRSCCAGNRRR
jgi:PAS domain S-box-containing protein